MANVASSLIAPKGPGRPPGTRRGAAWRWGRRFLGVGVAILAALFISFFTIDLGRIPGLKNAAEGAASRWLDRPTHIGRMEVRPGRGEYVISDFVIDGLPGGRPFFTAKTILVSMSWRTIVQRQLSFDVRLYDWQMLIEKWSDPDRHNIPRITGPPRPPSDPNKKGPFTYRTRSQAQRGTFIYEDHGTPWSVVAPNLSFDMAWSMFQKKYVGLASFTKGTVRIQDFLPMSADMATRFTLDGTLVTLPHIDLKTDGADTHVTGHLDFHKWPEQSYTVSSTIDFARMKEIFFAKENWQIGGQGRFAGVFNIYKDDPRGRDLSGDFTSDLATVNAFRFPNLHGSLVWLKDRFAVTHADADFYGGDTRFAYAIEPLGTPAGSTQKFAADFERVDLRQLRQVFDMRGIDLDGRARGRVAVAWPSGHLRQGVAGSGEISAMPPDGVTLATASLAAPLGFKGAGDPGAEFDPKRPLGPLPVGGDLTFRFDPEGVTFSDSTIATPTTFIAMKGRYDGQANIPFHVTSRDWQASDRLLAALMTAMNKPTDAVEVGGVGTFDGVMTQTFDAPRVQGHFTADDMAAWKVVWGHGEGDVVLADRYLDVSKGVMRRDAGTIEANGRFSLGFPRADGKDEIQAKISVRSWPLNDLRIAFKQTDWPVDGQIASSDLELHGLYANNGLYGSGPLRIEHGTAWNETFDVATGDLAFNGPSVDLTHVHITKGPGVLTGTATIGWDATYAFDVVGEKIAVESLDNFKIERAPLSGVMSIQANGQGRFDAPSYNVHADAPDLSVADQVIGHTSADLVLENGTLRIDHLDAESNRLRVFSYGQVTLSEPYDTVFNATFEDASIDPYLKFIMPKRAAAETGPAGANQVQSEFVHAIVFGTAKATGPLKDVSKMHVDATITQGTLSLFEYELHNKNDIQFSIADRKLTLGQFNLEGKGTSVSLTGGIAMSDAVADLAATGTVNLEILNSPNITSSGTATVSARLRGAFDSGLALTGSAEVEKGTLRYGTLPSLTDITGTLGFDDQGINADGLTAKMGGGPVTFGGNVAIDFNDFKRSEYHLTATGRQMRLRYPEGFSSKVDADLALSGPITAALLEGEVRVLNASYIKRIDTSGAGFIGFAGGTGQAEPDAGQVVVEDKYPLSYNVRIVALPSTLVIDSGPGTHIEGGGDLVYRGEGDRASLTGRVEIVRGRVSWNGNRFVLQSGAIDFANTAKIEPNFDVAAETRPRAPGQTYVVNIRISGTTSKLSLNLSSDPWLSEYDIIRLLLGEAPDTSSAAEIRALNTSNATPSLIQSAAAQLLASPVSATVGNALSTLPGAPTVTIAPVIGTELSANTTTARVMVGKEISSKVYLTYLRTLNAPTEFIQLDYQVSDALSWVLSRNEDRTFALGFRIRHVF